MSNQSKPSILTVLQSILSALTGGAISGGGSGGTTTTPIQSTHLVHTPCFYQVLQVHLHG